MALKSKTSKTKSTTSRSKSTMIEAKSKTNRSKSKKRISFFHNLPPPEICVYQRNPRAKITKPKSPQNIPTLASKNLTSNI